MAEQPAHRGARGAGFPLLDVDGLGPGTHVLLQCGVPPGHPGEKYPWALGRPAQQVWAEIWPDIGPRIETVLRTGQATWDECLLLFLERNGYVEETYHTFSYSPLPDERGAVAGLLCVVREDTERIVGERRMAILRDLGSIPTTVRDEEVFLEACARQLAAGPRSVVFVAM